VAAFAVSAYMYVTAHHRPAQKPFNPILGETYIAIVSMCVVCTSVRYIYVWDIITKSCIVHHLFADLLGRGMTTLKVQLAEQNKTKLHRALHGEVMTMQWSVEQKKFIWNGESERPRDLLSPFHQSSVQSP